MTGESQELESPYAAPPADLTPAEAEWLSRVKIELAGMLAMYGYRAASAVELLAHDPALSISSGIAYVLRVEVPLDDEDLGEKWASLLPLGASGAYIDARAIAFRVRNALLERQQLMFGKEGSGGVPNGRDWQFARTTDEKLAAAESIISARDAYEQELRDEIARLTSDKHRHAMCPECRRMARSGGVPTEETDAT